MITYDIIMEIIDKAKEIADKVSWKNVKLYKKIITAVCMVFIIIVSILLDILFLPIEFIYVIIKLVRRVMK